MVAFLESVEGVGDQDAVALIVGEQHEMGALVALKILVHIDGELSEYLERLASGVGRVDRQRALKHR